MPHGSHSKNETSSDKPETVQFIPLRCPVCGADISLKSGDDEVTCEYCGTQFLVTTDSETTDEPLIRLQSMRNPVAVFAEKKKQRKRKAITADKTVSVKVNDTTAPVFQPSDPIKVDYGKTVILSQKKADNAIVAVADDKSDVSYTITDVNINGKKAPSDACAPADDEVTFYKPGTYEVLVKASDAYGNADTQKETVIVQDRVSPEFAGLPKTIALKDSDAKPDYKAGIKANDEIDGDLTGSIQVDDSAVGYGKPGSIGK